MNYYLEVWRKYAVFEGRARRKEWWYFTLANFAIVTPATVISTITAVSFSIFSVLWLIYSLAALIPALAVSVRRLHDIGRSAWWMLVPFVPVVGLFVFLIFMVLPGDPEANEYGENPIKLDNNRG